MLDVRAPGFGGVADQAAGLRLLLGHAPLHAIALAGEGATTLTVNLAAALAAGGLEVLMVDENAKHGNIADQLGIHTRCELLHALSGERALVEVMREAGPGVRLLPAARGARELAAQAVQGRFAACLREAPPAPDLILIDSAGGGVSQLLRTGEALVETVIVAGASHDAITRAYSLIKSAAQSRGTERFRVIVNRARSEAEAATIFRNMAAVARKHAGASLELLGWMPHDAQCRHARAARRSAVAAFPAGATAAAARVLAERLCGRSAPPPVSSHHTAALFAEGAAQAMHTAAAMAAHAGRLFHPHAPAAAAF